MAKKSAYTKARESYMRQLRKAHKYGYEIANLKPPTERQLRAAGYKGAELTKLTKAIQKDLAEFWTENNTVIDTQSGELRKANKAASVIRDYNKITKENERRFWAGEEQIYVPERLKRTEYKPGDENRPHKGDIVYGNMVDEFLSRLNNHGDLTRTTYKGKEKSRNPSAIYAAQKGISLVNDTVDRMVAQYGKEYAGELIASYPNWEDDMDIMLYGYSDNYVNSGLNSLLDILTAGNYSQQMQKDLSEEADTYGIYDDYDDGDI